MAGPPIGASYPSVLPTTSNSNVFLSPQVPYKGDDFSPGTFHCLLEAAPGSTKTVTIRLYNNTSTLIAEVTINGTDDEETDTSVSGGDFADGDYFQAVVYNHDGVAADLSWVVGP